MTLSQPSRGFTEMRGGIPVTDKMAVAIDVATKHRISVALLRGREQRYLLRNARRELIQRLRDKGKTWSEIGRFMDHRDHTTIMDYLREDRRASRRR